MIKSNIIINGFLKAGFTGNSYLSNQEEKIINNCIYYMGINKEMEILDDLADEIETTGKENYRITSILAVAGEGAKLPPLIILKGESGKSIETKYRKIDFVENGEVLIYYQKNCWCTNEIFEEWLKKYF